LNTPTETEDERKFAARCLAWSRNRWQLSGPELPEHKLHRDGLGSWFQGHVGTSRRAARFAYTSLIALLLGWALVAFAPRIQAGDTEPVSRIVRWTGNTTLATGVTGCALAAYLSRRDRTAVLGLVDTTTRPMTPERYAQALAQRKPGQHLWVFAQGGFEPGVTFGDAGVRAIAGPSLTEVSVSATDPDSRSRA